MLGQPLIAPIFVHLGMKKILVDRRQLRPQGCTEMLQNLIVPTHKRIVTQTCEAARERSGAGSPIDSDTPRNAVRRSDTPRSSVAGSVRSSRPSLPAIATELQKSAPASSANESAIYAEAQQPRSGIQRSHHPPLGHPCQSRVLLRDYFCGGGSLRAVVSFLRANSRFEGTLRKP
jgi:hypothetical protein